MRGLILLLALGGPALADTVVATRTIRPQSILTAADLTVDSGRLPGAFRRPEAVIGQETRVVLYAGRPVLPEDIGPPAVIDRNQIVTLAYQRNGLSIRLDGRSLARAGIGERVRVMNLQSRATLTGRVQDDGTVAVD